MIEQLSIYIYIGLAVAGFVLLTIFLPFYLFNKAKVRHLVVKKTELDVLCGVLRDELKLANENTAEAELEVTKSEKAFAVLTETLDNRSKQLRVIEENVETIKSELIVSTSSLNQSKVDYEHLKTKSAEQQISNNKAINDLKDAKEIMLKEFGLLANDILEKKGKTFTEQSHRSLEQLLTPFKQELSGFKDKVEAIQKDDIKNRTQLHSELKHLRDLNQRITDDADNLTRALKGEKKLQGNWGEIQLEKILEISGLIKGREFEREPNFKDEEGRNKRPDFIVNLPDGKHLIVDSKVSLNAYLEYSAADDAEQQKVALAKHVAAIRNHINSLNEKDYSTLTGLQSPDFVFMFMPIEPAFNVALQSDFSMFEDAFAKNIIIVTPTTLLATLKTVASIWTIEKQNAKSAELASKASAVYDKLRGFLEKMEKLDTQLNTTRNTFDDAMKTLRNGSGNLVRQAEQFKELGVRVKKDIPEIVLAKSDMAGVLEASDH
jgi:DNA recombination protein RmuC